MTFYRALCAGFRKRRPIGQTIFLTSVFWLVFHCFVLQLWVIQEPLPNSNHPVDDEHVHKEQEILVTNENTLWTYKAMNLTFWKPLKKIEDGDRTGPGEGGHPVTITKGIEEEMKKTFHINKFNLIVSNMVALDRFLPDRRLETCINLDIPPLLPQVSIIIAFHNEAWSTLIRTIQSIKDRTPSSLIKEIILVDDCSDQTHLKTQLDSKVAKMNRNKLPVTLIRMDHWGGLIKARLRGSALAKGKVLVFLDSHCECNHGWLEPLLAEIYRNRTNVVCPVIDQINDKTFSYSKSSLSLGGFNWRLIFKWYGIDTKERRRHGDLSSQPIRSPAMAGGLFAIDREYFYHLGAYDEEMKFWGGENVDLSFRIWQCGGTLLIHPCSHVGHVFRSTTPHDWDGGLSGRNLAITRNLVRAVDVWMDEPWRDFYYLANPGARSINPGNLTRRFELKERLQCKSFSWYMQNIYYQSDWTLEYRFLGYIRNPETDLCWDTKSLKSSSKLQGWPCHGIGGPQTFMQTYEGYIIQDELRVVVNGQGRALNIYERRFTNPNNRWLHSTDTLQLVHLGLDLCATVDGNTTSTSPVREVLLTICTDANPNQQWELVAHDYGDIKREW